MNPWAFIAIALGVIFIIMGIKGTQHNITGAITGHNTTPPASGGGSVNSGGAGGSGKPILA